MSEVPLYSIHSGTPKSDQRACPDFISQKVFIRSFCKSQFPHKSVHLSLITTNTKNKLTNLCGNRLLQNDFVNTFREIESRQARWSDFGMPLWIKYRGTSLIRKRTLLGPYRSLCLKSWGGPWGVGVFVWARYPCTAHIRQPRLDSGLVFQLEVLKMHARTRSRFN